MGDPLVSRFLELCGFGLLGPWLAIFSGSLQLALGATPWPAVGSAHRGSLALAKAWEWQPAALGEEMGRRPLSLGALRLPSLLVGP